MSSEHTAATPGRQPPRPASGERGELRTLALRAGAGDAAALTELIRATSRQVWWACAALVDRDSADDLAQETYLRAVRSLPGYRGEAEPLRWLLSIARRTCAGEIASRQRARQLAARAGGDLSVAISGPAVGVEMADAIARLPTARREAFLLTAVAGFSYAEAAAACGCPIGTVRSRVARARAELLDALDLIHNDHTSTTEGAGEKGSGQMLLDRALNRALDAACDA